MNVRGRTPDCRVIRALAYQQGTQPNRCLYQPAVRVRVRIVTRLQATDDTKAGTFRTSDASAISYEEAGCSVRVRVLYLFGWNMPVTGLANGTRTRMPRI